MNTRQGRLHPLDEPIFIKQYFLRTALVAFLFTPALASAATYYVSTSGSDSNPGTQTSPFKTITKADGAVSAGDTVHVAPGTYTGPITTRKNGTASSRITYISDTRWGAKILGSGSGNLNWISGWEILGNYTTVDGFEVNGAGIWRGGITGLGTGDLIKNNHVHHIMNNVGCQGTGGSGISASGWPIQATNVDVIGNIVHDIGPPGACAWIHGLYIQAPDSKVYNNISYANSGYGIHLWHDDRREKVVNNTVFNNRYGAIVHGASVSDLDYETTCAQNNYFANNILYDNANNNIQISGNCQGTGHVKTNNLIGINPQFVNYIRTGGGNYRLTASSPAINTGISTNAPTTDYDGVSRPQNSAYDIGAYEFGGTPPPPPPPLASSPVGHWELDETSGTSASDSSGNGNTGTLTNGPVWTTGPVGNAVSFDGVNDIVNIGDPASGILDFGTGSFSYGLWVYHRTPVGSWDIPWYKGGSSASEIGYDMELGSGPWTANLNDGSTASQAVFASSPILNQWVHLVAVVDRANNQLKVYKDGAFVAQKSISGLRTLSSARPARIGGIGRFRGAIDDVRVYNRALSAQEVEQLYLTE